MTAAVLALVDGDGTAPDRSALNLAAGLAWAGGLPAHVLATGRVPAGHGCAKAWEIGPSDGRGLAQAMTDLMQETPYSAIVAQDTPLCREAIGRLAGRLGLALVCHVMAARAFGDVLEVVRSVENGRRTAKYEVACRPALLLVDPDASFPVVAPALPEPPVETIEGMCAGELRVIAERVLAASEVDLEEADVVVAGGGGVGGPEGFRLIAELAGLLHGSVAASRVAVDLGWAARSAQVGMTGKTVHPRLYIACGISGAVHHTFGMKDAGFVVAINKDPAAPIFKFADAAIVGDTTEILTELLALLRARPSSLPNEVVVTGAPA